MSNYAVLLKEKFCTVTLALKKEKNIDLQ